LAINLLLGVYVAFFKTDALSLETLKAGWAENMKLAAQLYNSDVYKQQQKSTLEQILGSLWTTATDTTTADTTAAQADATTATQGDAAKFAAIEKDGYIKGNKNARITIIEYSDMLCPFCKRHYNAQTIENLIVKYPNDVNMVFRQMPLPQLHPTAPIWAQGAVCVGKLAGADKYYAYTAKAFQLNEFTEANVTDIAVWLGVNKSKFASCLTSAETIAQVAAEVAEGNGFGINGTPGNLVVDNQKGTYTLIAGAYPTETFEAEITKILGK
jgi:protein-disulfide isomerase